MSPTKRIAPKKKGKAPAEPSIPPPPPTNPFGIIFRNDEQEQRYNTLLTRKIVKTKYVDERTLEILGLKDDVYWMFDKVGLREFFEMKPETYLPVVLEFLSSVEVGWTEYIDHTSYGEVRFRMMNEERVLTFKDIRKIFHFPRKGKTEPPISFMDHMFWNQITTDNRFAASTARASRISNPCIRYAHRILAHTLFGRGDSDGIVTQTELFMLWSMLNGFIVDVTLFFTRHLSKVAKARKGTIVIGGFITQIALHLGIAPYGIEVARGNSRIDIESCVAMKMIEREGDTYRLILQPGLPTLPLPNPGRTTVQNLENWKLSPGCVSYATPAPESSIPPPPPTWGDDPFGMSMDSSPPRPTEPPPHGATGSSSSYHADPGYQTIAAQLYRQEQRQERIMGGIGRIHEEVGHMRMDIEALGNYMEDMGNFLYERMGYEDPRRGGIYGGAGEGASRDPVEGDDEDDEETDSDQ